MHAATLTSSRNNQVRRAFKALLPGRPLSSLELARRCKTVAPATVISALRLRLRGRYVIICKRRGRRWYYHIERIWSIKLGA